MAVRTILIKERGPRNRKVRASAFELELPPLYFAARVSAAEFEVPALAPTQQRGLISAYELQVPSLVTVADPTLLPVATGQAPDGESTYGRNLSAGESYVDPTTGVTVYKVTDASWGAANTRCHPVYAESGPYVSLPWGAGGNWYTMYIQTRHGDAPSNRFWLIDFNISTGAFTNLRQFSSDIETSFSFSALTSQPRIAYTIKSTINRYDTATDSNANTGNFPKSLSGDPWYLARGSVFHHDKNDEWFLAVEYQKLDLCLWNSVTDDGWMSTAYHGAQDKLDRGGTYCFPIKDIAGKGQWYRMVLSTKNITEPYSDVHSIHPAGTDGFLVTQDGNRQYYVFDPATSTKYDLGSQNEVTTGSGHFAGQWTTNNGATRATQWVLFSGYGTASEKIDNAVAFLPLDYPTRSARLLCHHDTVNPTYEEQPHATISPDGRLVMFGSNQNGSGRPDVFLAVVPTS